MRHLRFMLIFAVTLAPLAEVRASVQQNPTWGSQNRAQRGATARRHERARRPQPAVVQNRARVSRAQTARAQAARARQAHQRGQQARVRHAQAQQIRVERDRRLRRDAELRRRQAAERGRFARLLTEELRRERSLVAQIADLDARLADLRRRHRLLGQDRDALALEREALICEREEVLARKDDLLARRDRFDRRGRRGVGRGAEILIDLIGVRVTPVESRRFRRELARCDERLALIEARLCEIEVVDRDLCRRQERLDRRAEVLRCDREVLVRDLNGCRARCGDYRTRIGRLGRVHR